MKALTIAVVAAFLAGCAAHRQRRLLSEEIDCQLAAVKNDHLTLHEARFLISGCHAVYLMKGGKSHQEEPQ